MREYPALWPDISIREISPAAHTACSVAAHTAWTTLPHYHTATLSCCYRLCAARLNFGTACVLQSRGPHWQWLVWQQCVVVQCATQGSVWYRAEQWWWRWRWATQGALNPHLATLFHPACCTTSLFPTLLFLGLRINRFDAAHPKQTSICSTLQTVVQRKRMYHKTQYRKSDV